MPLHFASKSVWTAALANGAVAVLDSKFATVSAVLQCAVLALQIALLLQALWAQKDSDNSSLSLLCCSTCIFAFSCRLCDADQSGQPCC